VDHENSILYTGSAFGIIQVFEFARKNLPAKFKFSLDHKFPNKLTYLYITINQAKGLLIIGSSDCSVFVLNIKNKSKPPQLQEKINFFSSGISFMTYTTFIVAGKEVEIIYTGSKDHFVRGWNAGNGGQKKTPLQDLGKVHDGDITCICYDYSGHYLYTAAEDKTLQMHSMDEKNPQDAPEHLKNSFEKFPQPVT
jgi:WD40 repeat protein